MPQEVRGFSGRHTFLIFKPCITLCMIKSLCALLAHRQVPRHHRLCQVLDRQWTAYDVTGGQRCLICSTAFDYYFASILLLLHLSGMLTNPSFLMKI
jgi:hypothetical protein